MKAKILSFLSLAGFLAVSLFTNSALAADHKVVIQVSSKDPLTQKIVVNNAINLQKHYGMDNIDIEIVAYGPGLSMLTPKSAQAKRVSSLTYSNIKVQACGNTIKKMTRKNGKAPKLVEGVTVTPGGAARIIELQEQGYSYLKP